MATQPANQFLERLSTDAAFRAQFHAIDTTKIMDILDFALSQEFVFTEKDLKSSLATYPNNPTIDQLREKLKIPNPPQAAHMA